MTRPATMHRSGAACRAWESGMDMDILAETARYAAELRAARGIPANQPCAWDQEAHEDWPAADRQALAEIQAMVRDVLIAYHDGDGLDWIVEETLWQIRAKLQRDGSVRIPMTAVLGRASDGRVYGAGVGGLDAEVGP